MVRLTFAAIALLLALLPMPVAAQSEVEDIIRQSAARYGVSGDLLSCMAFKESSFNPGATHYYADGSTDQGVMQFHVFYPSGYSLMQETPWSYASPYDVVAASEAAAWLIARGNGPAWSTYWLCA